MLKKILKITGIAILTLILLAFLIPVVFKKQVTRLVKNEINKNLTAKVDFSGVRLSLLRHFPRVTIILKDFTITGSENFHNDTLIAAPTIDISANFFSLLRGKNIKVYGAYFKAPRIHALVDSNGKANWDIVRKKKKETGVTDTSASAFRLSIKNYSINDGYIEYRDDRAKTYTEWSHVNHSGSGDFNKDVFTLSTTTRSDRAYFTQDGIPWLAGTKTDIRADIGIDTRTQTYTFNTEHLVLNDLRLYTKGFFRIVNDSTYRMDITFRSPENDFKNTLSLVPVIYRQDFDKLQAGGEAAFNGWVKGDYSPLSFPAYDIKLDVRNGSFKYPDLPKPVKNIGFNLHASNPDGLPDHAVIDIPAGHLQMGDEPFDFRFVYRNPRTVKYIDAAARGNLDLSQVTKFIKLRNNTKLAGQTRADAWIKGNLAAIKNLQGAFGAGGFFDVKNLYYASNDFPQPIRNGNMMIRLENSGGVADNTIITFNAGHIEVGNDPVDFNGKIVRPFSTLDFSGHAKGRFTLDNVKQFTRLTPGTSLSGLLNADLDFTGNKSLVTKGVYDKMNVQGNAGLNNLKYKDRSYPTGISLASANLVFNPASVNISGVAGHYLGSDFSAAGSLNNLLSYLARGETVSGSLVASLDKIDLNEWTGKTASAASSANPTPFLVPGNMNITINASAGKATYDKVDYNNISGKLLIGDETIRLQTVKAESLDGTIVLNGSYSTRVSKTKPDINLSYDVQDMDVQKVFYAFNTSNFLMPIGKFLSGKLNSALTMTGNLKGNMMPDLQSLAGKGNLLLLHGVLKKFAPVDKLANLLQIEHLKSISVRDIKNYIEFAHGKVLVKPFTVKFENIEMLISGFHGFDNSIDYAINMKLPRSIMGSKGNEFVNDLAAQANRNGIPLKLGETINLNIKMTGTITNPFIGINIKGMVDDVIKDMEQQAKDFLKAKLDSAKERAADSLFKSTDKWKDSLGKKIKEQVFGKDTSSKNNLPPVKNIIKGIFNRVKKSQKDSQ